MKENYLNGDLYILCKKESEAEGQLWKTNKNNRLLSKKKQQITDRYKIMDDFQKH